MDVNSKKEFIKNTYAPIYKTINQDILKNEDQKMLFSDIEEQKKDAYRLKIIIDSDISESKLQNILAYSYSHPDVIIDKRFKGLSKKNEDKLNEELKKKQEYRNEIIGRFKNMDFFNVTCVLAKEKFNMNFSVEEIKELLN